MIEKNLISGYRWTKIRGRCRNKLRLGTKVSDLLIACLLLGLQKCVGRSLHANARQRKGKAEKRHGRKEDEISGADRELALFGQSFFFRQNKVTSTCRWPSGMR